MPGVQLVSERLKGGRIGEVEVSGGFPAGGVGLEEVQKLKAIVQEFSVGWVRVSVAKPGAIEGSREVGVTIERNADDYA